jgi:hypothetical protein
MHNECRDLKPFLKVIHNCDSEGAESDNAIQDIRILIYDV